MLMPNTAAPFVSVATPEAPAVMVFDPLNVTNDAFALHAIVAISVGASVSGAMI